MKPKLFSLFLFMLMASALFAQEMTYSSENYQKFKEELIAGNIEKANEVLTKWEKETPKDPELYCSYATMYWMMSAKQIEESDDLMEIENSAMLPDTIAMFQNMQVKSYRIMKDKGNGMEQFNKSVEWMEKCINEYPDIAEAYYNYIEILNHKKEFKYSTKVVFKFLDQSIKNNGKWLNYALTQNDSIKVEELIYQQTNSLLEGAEYELAERMLDHAIEIYPQNAMFIMLKGACYENIMQIDKAMECYEKAVAVDSTNYRLMAYLLVCHLRLKNVDRVLELAKKLEFCGDPEAEQTVKSLGPLYSEKVIEVNGKKVDTSRYKEISMLSMSMEYEENDSAKIEKKLAQWEKEEPDNADMMKCRAIFHNALAKLELQKVREAQDQNALTELEDIGLGKVTVRKWEPGDEGLTGDANFQKALDWEKKCLKANPDRKDMYLLLFETALNLRDETSIYEAALAAAERGSETKGQQWLKEFNLPIQDNTFTDERLFEGAMQGLYQLGSMDYAKKILSVLHNYFKESDFLTKWDEMLK